MSGDENTKGTMTFGQEIQGITSAHLYAQQQQGNTVAQERAEEQLRHYEVAAQNILDVQRGAIRGAADRPVSIASREAISDTETKRSFGQSNLPTSRSRNSNSRTSAWR
ncbi:hypothetical protein HYV74_03235 [Candidatus Uhrbacteria bacterium]|nr:hypothetical protein [Candidatus Uhrbacteria bacterium]